MNKHIRNIHLNISDIRTAVLELSVDEAALRQVGLTNVAHNIGNAIRKITNSCDELYENIGKYRNRIDLSEKIMLLVLENENEAFEEVNEE